MRVPGHRGTYGVAVGTGCAIRFACRVAAEGCSPVSLERDADSVQNRLLMENLAGLVSR